MKPPVNTADEHAAIESPSVDRSRRHENDARLRAAGFAIHARPKKGPAIWIKGGVLFPEREALDKLGAQEKA